MEWVAWMLVGVVPAVVAVAWLLSSGRLHDSFERPYAQSDPHPEELPSRVVRASSSSALGSSGIGWFSPAPGRWRRDDVHTAEPEHHPRTTGEHVDGRHEAQNR